MKANQSPKPKQGESWPRKVQPGRASVSVYRRELPNGNYGFQVANYLEGDKRRLDSYPNETEALAAADKLAKQIDQRDYVGASMTPAQAIEFANATSRLKPFNLTVDSGTAALVEILKQIGDLPNLRALVKTCGPRFRQITAKPVGEVVAEFLKIKEARQASPRYLEDLRVRLSRFAKDCQKDACNVTTAEIQEWLDNLELSPQSYKNYRTVLHGLFAFAVKRSYAADNPVHGAEQIKIRGGDISIFTPAEISRLLYSAQAHYPDFLPCLALQAFAGLRSAEIMRLSWSDIHFEEKQIVISASNAKTASRRIIPLHDCLAAWLLPYAMKTGRIWDQERNIFHKRQEAIARATKVQADDETGTAGQKAVEWQSNALRHSYASYRFAQIGDAGRVASELGNTVTVVHKHYRELVKPKDAEKWFAILPEQPANILPVAIPA
jgi:integrase